MLPKILYENDFEKQVRLKKNKNSIEKIEQKKQTKIKKNIKQDILDHFYISVLYDKDGFRKLRDISAVIFPENKIFKLPQSD